jgi:hypothetical protein
MTEHPEHWSVDTRKWYVEKEWTLRIQLHQLNILPQEDIAGLTAFICFHTTKTELSRAVLTNILTQNLRRYCSEALADPTNDLAQFMVLHSEWFLAYSFVLPPVPVPVPLNNNSNTLEFQGR